MQLLRRTLLLLFTVLLAAELVATGQAGTAPFDEKAAAALLVKISLGVNGHSQKRMLEAFDVARMRDGGLFLQQIDAFFSQTESMRAHLNLVTADTQQDGTGTVQVDIEMEAVPINSQMPVHKQARVTFTASGDKKGWRFTDVQPRSFFSLSQP